MYEYSTDGRTFTARGRYCTTIGAWHNWVAMDDSRAVYVCDYCGLWRRKA